MVFFIFLSGEMAAMRMLEAFAKECGGFAGAWSVLQERFAGPWVCGRAMR